MKNLIIKNWPLILIIFLSFLITWPLLLPGYFPHHDDLQVMRIFEMRKCFLDLQIPCRWVPDMGFGNGFPLFNYYGPFPYYIGAFLTIFLGFVWAAKALFFIPLLLGGVSMYLLGKELFGKIPGMTAGVLYLFAPYRAVDAYVRGAIAESFALALSPLVFYFFFKLVKERSLKFFWGASITLGLFLTIHNIMNLFFIPLLVLFVIFHLFIQKGKNFLPVTISMLLGVGLAAYFLLVQTNTLTRFDLDFRVHFVTVGQLFFERAWGYGASVLGPKDLLSFQTGWPHWWLVPVAFILFIFTVLKKREKTLENAVLIALFLGVFVFSVFMTHNKSAFVWEGIGILRFAQFPWRFLSLTIFAASLLGGFVLCAFIGRIQKVLAILIIFLAVALNWNYFRPESFNYSVTDSNKLSGPEWETQQKASILDYLPETALEPREKAPPTPLIRSGQASVMNFIQRSNSFEFDATVDTISTIEVPVFDFPNWQVFINGVDISHSNKNFLGRISLNLGPGQYRVKGKFNDTGIRSLGNMITLASIFIGIFLVIYGKHKKFFK
ncbi:MAG: hypothetical protein UU67_C0017G0002 [Candidatus Daviesbacteria bacterium GW2011_GWB1_41_5]|uniref:Membrane protein 6-pyruvoyl-tetrahydropterin synthase-related domain-containing protein n=1 Tax=Candidatus Daviesbacteria bacterium GW2011_GWB1_41_5 TaxID=1618429 RepID=A0A0G0WNW7_9BACT|nr:MAG: hypothetical protein UU67_C0017G0002 [Candidatus Daviesbacteria bacterium GW2011_GWB1_41_5]